MGSNICRSLQRPAANRCERRSDARALSERCTFAACAGLVPIAALHIASGCTQLPCSRSSSDRKQLDGRVVSIILLSFESVQLERRARISEHEEGGFQQKCKLPEKKESNC